MGSVSIRPYVRVALSLAIIAGAFALRWLLAVLFATSLPPFLTFYPAVMCVALLFGLRYGMFSVLLSALAADLLIFPPVGSFYIADRSQAISLFFFCGMGVFMSGIAGKYRRTQQLLAAEKARALDEAHQKLHVMSQRQRSLEANMDEAYARCEMIYDRNGLPVDYRILEVNAAYEHQTGLKASEVVGKTVLERFPDVERSWIEQYGNVATTGEAKRFENYNHNTGRHYDIFAYSPSLGHFSLLILDITGRKRAEAALRSSQARLQSIVGSAMDAVISIDEQQRIVLFNQRAEEIFRCSASAVLGASLDRFLPVSSRIAHRQHIQRFATEGVSQRPMHATAILTGVRSDGEEFPVEAAISQVTVEGEKLFTVILRDVSERVRAESALRESVTQFHTLADAIPQLAWMAHADGSIFWYNQRWFDYTGTTQEQMEGWGWQSVHDSNTLPRVLSHWKSSIASGEPFDMVFPLRGKDGYFRPFLTRVMPLKDEHGKVLRWFGTNTDISDQKRTESELRLSKARLDMAVEVAAVGEWELNLDTKLGTRSARHARIFGYAPSERSWSFDAFLDHVVPEHRAQVERTITLAYPKASWDFETQIRRVDGELRWIWVRGRISRDEAGRASRAFGTVIDVTDRKSAETALLRSEKLASVGQMAAAISHEINNPLGAVTNLIFLAKAMDDLPPTARHYLDLADEELRRVAHITRQSLGFYRESNAPASTSINEVLTSAIHLMRGKIKSKHATIRTEWDGEVRTTAVAGELRQVFANLLANSLDAIEDYGTIKLRIATTGPSGQCVRIIVADNGKGIPPNSQKHLFEPFYTTKGTVGTGLGLWVSKQIVHKHSGNIRVRSASNGTRRGTVFCITLPIDTEVRAAHAMQ